MLTSDAHTRAHNHFPRQPRLTCRLGHFDQTSAEHVLEARLEVEVLGPPGHRDEQVGRRELPLLGEELVEDLRAGVRGDARVLKHS